MTDFQYQMAFIDWDKYGHSFNKLQETPDQLGSCVGTMLGDFSCKDLLKAVPEDGPWAAIRTIQALGPDAMQRLYYQRKPLDSAVEAKLRTACLEFGNWASWYFAGPTPPWQRGSGRSATNAASGGCGSVIPVLLVPVLIFTIFATFSVMFKAGV